MKNDMKNFLWVVSNSILTTKQWPSAWGLGSGGSTLKFGLNPQRIFMKSVGISITETLYTPTCFIVIPLIKNKVVGSIHLGCYSYWHLILILPSLLSYNNLVISIFISFLIFVIVNFISLRITISLHHSVNKVVRN